MKLRRLVLRMRSVGPLRPVATFLLAVLGSDVPSVVQIGHGFDLAHGGIGVVIHEQTTIGKNVRIYQGVTLGRANAWQRPRDDFEGFRLDDHCVIGAGAAILCTSGLVHLGEGTVVGANAVLRESTPPWTIWAGNPARCVGTREPIAADGELLSKEILETDPKGSLQGENQ